MGYCNKSIMLGLGPAPGVELRVAIQVVRRRLGDEFREPAESELSAGVTSPPVSGVRGLPLTPDDRAAMHADTRAADLDPLADDVDLPAGAR